jgi:protein TonB
MSTQQSNVDPSTLAGAVQTGFLREIELFKEELEVPAELQRPGSDNNPSGPAKPPRRDDDEEDEEKSFLQRHRGVLIGGALLGMIVVGIAFLKPAGPSAPARRVAEPPMVRIQLPPPPPPPKVQPTPPPPEQKMVEQKPVAEEEKVMDKPKDEPPKAKDEPPALGTNIRGNGPADGFGLGSSGNGFGGGPSRGAGGSKWGWYAGQVQSRIAEALRSNPRTRTATIKSLQVRVWPDSSGRITRAQLVGSTGNQAVDDAIRNEVLNGLRLQEPPPPGLPTPIVLRLTARRPS